MLLRLSRSLGQSRLLALSRLVNDLYQDAVSRGSPRDQVSPTKEGGGCSSPRRDLPGCALQVESCARSSAEGRSPTQRVSRWGGQTAHWLREPHSPGSNGRVLSGGSGESPVGTKTGSPWGALSPKPAEPPSQVCGCSAAGRAKEGRSRSPLAEQPERPGGSRSSAAALP